MIEPEWLDLAIVRALHSVQISEHGGSLGLRDQGLLESALARPIDLYRYPPDSDFPGLAASHGFGIARSHAFVDGNRRVAFQAMYVFLGLNGLRIEADEAEVVRVMLALASGQLDEGGLAQWLREHTVDRD